MDAIRLVVLFGGFSLAYLLLHYLFLKVFSRFYDNNETESPPSATPRQSPDSSYDEVDTYTAANKSASTTVVCPACGVENDRQYTFCRNCVAELR